MTAKTSPSIGAAPVMSKENSSDNINQVRQEIDQIDRRILELLNERAQKALATAPFKAAGAVPEYSPTREVEVIRNLCQTNQGPLSDIALTQILREVISACRALQRPLRVAFLGPAGTYSHLAALRHFGVSCDFMPLESIAEAIDKVERGQAAVAVVPVENSSEGGVGATMDCLMSTSLPVCGEIYLRVSHALMSSRSALSQVETVYSHPQALAQCRRWLSRKLPRAEQRECASTAAAAHLAASEPQAAAIGSLNLAEHYGLVVLAEDIQDSPQNLTRFLVLGRQVCAPTGEDKTSLLFAVAHRPGSLYRALGHFAQRGINLSRIESRPIKDRPWEYAFSVDFWGHRQEPQVAEALQALSGEVEFLKVLGSYPRAETIPAS